MAGANNHTLTQWAQETRQDLRSIRDPFTLTQDLRSLNATTRRKLAQHARSVNSKNVFVSLPHAVLRRIVVHLSPYHVSPVRFSHICSQLREYTLHDTEIWSKLIPPWLSGNVDFLNMMVERSRPGPLQLFLEVTPSPSSLSRNERAQRVCRLVSENLHRTSTLRLYFNPRMNLPGPSSVMHGLPFLGPYSTLPHVTTATQWGVEHWRLFLDAVRQPAPLLQRLSMSVMAFGLEPFKLPADIFSGHAPSLKTCTLTGVSLTREAYDGFAQLTTLKYTPEPSWINADELSHILAGLPKLETLYLHVRTFEWQTPDPSTVPANSAVRRVRLDGMRHGSHHLRPYFTALPNLREIAFGRSFDFHDPVSDTWQTYPVISSLSLSYRAGELVARRRDRPDELRFVFVPEMLDVRGMLQQSAIYTHLTVLTLHEFFWPEAGTLPDAPTLATFRLILGSCLDYSYDYFTMFQPNQGIAGVFVLPPPHPPWNVPALRAVHLAYSLPHKCYRYLDMTYRCCCRDVLAVSFADVAEFLFRGMQWGPERLAEISFSGIEPVDADLEACLDQLNALADVVHLSPYEDGPGLSKRETQIWERGENYSLFDRALWA